MRCFMGIDGTQERGGDGCLIAGEREAANRVCCIMRSSARARSWLPRLSAPALRLSDRPREECQVPHAARLSASRRMQRAPTVRSAQPTHAAIGRDGSSEIP